MRIALLVHCFFPRSFYGTEAYTLTLAKVFQAEGHDVTVVSANPQDEPRQDAPITHYEWEGVPVVSIDKNAWPHASVAETYDQPAMEAVHAQLFAELRPDIVHVCHLINHTAAAVRAAARLGVPLFATLTDFFGFCLTNKLEAADGSLCAGPDSWRRNCLECHLKADAARSDALPHSRRIGDPARRARTARVMALSARIAPSLRWRGFRPADVTQRPGVLTKALGAYRAAIAPSTFLMRAYQANGFPAPLHVSHFGVDIDRAPKPVAAEREALRLGYVGQLAPHKGVDLLLRALHRAGARDVRLTIWGDEAQDPAYAATLRSLASGLNVTFAGTVPRQALAGALAGIDGLAIPSLWYENSPLILLQALATHTPVIVSDVEGLTEFIAEGQSGFAFPRGDEAALSGLIADLALRPARLRGMSATTAYSRTSEDMAKDVLELYARHGLA